MRRRRRAEELLRVLWRDGPLTRRELEDSLHISRPTLDRLLGELQRRGLVSPTGVSRGRGGRPAVLFRLEPRARFALGVDLELPGLYFVVTDLCGNTLHERGLRLGADLSSPQRVLRRIASLLLDWLRELGIPRERVLGVGVGMPAFFEGDAVTVKGKNLPTWIRVPARGILERSLGMPVLLGHDVHLMSLAESHRADLGDRIVLYLALRLGIRDDIRMGACLLVRGQLYRGAHGNGGTLHRAFVEPEAIPPDPRGAAELVAERLAPHILQAVALLDPEVVVINAHELGELAAPVAEALEARVAAGLEEEPLGPVEVRRARVTRAPGALGAAMAVLQELFERPERLLAGEPYPSLSRPEGKT